MTDNAGEHPAGRSASESRPGASAGSENRPLIIVSNRLPVSLKIAGSSWLSRPSSGGLVSALHGLDRSNGFKWVGWPGCVIPPALLEEVKESLAEVTEKSSAFEDSLVKSHSRAEGLDKQLASSIDEMTGLKNQLEAAEKARWAEEHGFTTMKVKARPWYDIDAQLRAVSEASSLHFKLDADFNGLLLGVDKAAPLIGRLEDRYERLAIVESPLPQDDVAGNKLLRQKIRSPISMHFGSPPVMTAIGEGVCDGFVIGGGVKRVLDEGTLAAQAKMPFWLQMVGTGLTTTFAVHLGAVLKEARWPAIPCINIYSHTLLKEFDVEGGHIAVPQAPGLGVELDWDAVERFRVEGDFKKEPVRQIHEIHWPEGRTTHYSSGSYRADFLAGKLTGFVPNIRLEVRLDDGSAEFNRAYEALFGSS